MKHQSSARRTNLVCVQVVGQGMPIRCPREDAHRLVVIDGDAQYCPKKLWREHQKYVEEKAPESAKWPFSARYYRIDAKGKWEGVASV